MKSFRIGCGLFILIGVTYASMRALVIGNFTTHDLRITVIDAHNKKIRDDFVFDDQHYTNVGDIVADQLPLVVKVWHKFESRRVESTILAQFKVVSVAQENIVFHSSDIWLIFQDESVYEDDEPRLLITNLASQDTQTPEPDRTKGLAPTPTPEVPVAQKAEEEPAKEPIADQVSPEMPIIPDMPSEKGAPKTDGDGKKESADISDASSDDESAADQEIDDESDMPDPEDVSDDLNDSISIGEPEENASDDQETQAAPTKDAPVAIQALSNLKPAIDTSSSIWNKNFSDPRTLGDSSWNEI